MLYTIEDLEVMEECIEYLEEITEEEKKEEEV